MFDKFNVHLALCTKETKLDMEVMATYLQPLLLVKKTNVGINMSRPNRNSLFSFLIN
jgi:hypothetical protein